MAQGTEQFATGNTSKILQISLFSCYLTSIALQFAKKKNNQKARGLFLFVIFCDTAAKQSVVFTAQYHKRFSLNLHNLFKKISATEKPLNSPRFHQLNNTLIVCGASEEKQQQNP